MGYQLIQLITFLLNLYFPALYTSLQSQKVNKSYYMFIG